MASIVFSAGRSALCADAGSSPRRATSFLAARQERRQRNVPCSQRPRKFRFANLSGQPALATNTGVRHNSLRAEALHSNRCRKSEHEVWLSCGSQTAGIGCDRRRWLKGGPTSWTAGQPTTCGIRRSSKKTARLFNGRAAWRHCCGVYSLGASMRPSGCCAKRFFVPCVWARVGQGQPPNWVR